MHIVAKIALDYGACQMCKCKWGMVCATMFDRSTAGGPSNQCIKLHLYASFAENIEELIWLSATSGTEETLGWDQSPAYCGLLIWHWSS